MGIDNFETYTNKEGQNFHIYLDMDGVLCDFNKAFINISENSEGLSMDDYIDKYGLHNAWRIVSEEGLEWWSEMDWMHDGKLLWAHLKQYNPTILSAPSRDRLSSEGKVIWVNRELGLDIDKPTVSPKNHRWDKDSRMILNAQKYMFAKRYPNSILIDDTPKKVTDWKNNGGIGILHKDAYQTIRKLHKVIQSL